MELSQKQEQFTREYSALFDYVYRYIRYRVPHIQDSEDIVSEVFFDTYKKLSSYDPTQGSLKQWITGFARHKMLGYWRNRKLVISLEDIDQLPDADSALESGIEQSMLVEKVLRGLPPHTKVLLAMRFVDGLTYEEIGQATQKEPEAIRQYFSRLYRKLRLSFSEE